MLDKLFFGSRLHEHADPAQRVLGVSALAPDSPLLVTMLGADPSVDVRAAAAVRCGSPAALLAALNSERESRVRTAIEASLGGVLAATPDADTARAIVDAPECTDAVRAELALRAQDEGRRRAAIDAIGDEEQLVRVALDAEHASVRFAAAERVHSAEPLRRLLKGAIDKDRGVARLARERLDAIHQRIERASTADALLKEAEALVAQPGPIVMAAVELDRRWNALALGDDADRRARWEEIGRRMKERFDRDLEEQRAHTQFEQRLNRWLATLESPESTDGLPALREGLASLRVDAVRANDAHALARLDQAERQIVQWEQAAPALAAAEALVAEAEQLAADTTIDDAQLGTRWQALDAAGRTPGLTRRFEAALLVIEHRRDAYVRANQQEQGTARHQLHEALHAAEQALAAGQLQEARAAAERVRALKAHAGLLPKPSVQRLSRVVQQLNDLEKWQKFGQQNARVQLCERAEALAQGTLAAAALARDVQQLRAEWKKLDEQYAVVPKPLWERFDGACERAYAPAARHFAEQAALRKQARKQREDFIAAAAAHAPTLLGEPRDWRAIERWLRETEAAWRDATLGSVDPGTWKKLDARLKEALAPPHDALSAARRQARHEREALIADAEALAAKGAERDLPSRVKALQARWQAHARTIVLAQRDERALWERFRTACKAAFDARSGSRKEEDQRKQGERRALEALCEQLEQLAQSDADEAEIRRVQREVQEGWRAASTESGPVPSPIEARFKRARTGVEELLRGRTRKAEAAVWETRLAKERLCEELDALASSESDPEPDAAEHVQQRWDALPALSSDWESRLAERRDAALGALADSESRADHAERIRASTTARGDALLELELMLGIPSPADLQAQRLAVQVRELRDRFKRTPSGGAVTAADVLLKWCSLPGVAESRDRQRCERIVAGLERRR
ncbi:MAG TPA: DUF349 domain-containing protein [Burkholderiaceae bacterium]|nr:DUF349 domain-containing protein [Burkholderiaceae bacterium]